MTKQQDKQTGSDKLEAYTSSSIHALIAMKRKESGLTVREFAKKYGLSSTVLNQLENNKVKTPSIKTIRAISELLQITPAAIFNYYGVPMIDSKVDNKISHKQNLIEALSNYGVPTECLQDILDYIKFKVVCNNKEAYSKFLDLTASSKLFKPFEINK